VSADEAQRSRVVLGGTAAHLPSALNTALPKEMDLQVTMSSARKQIENSPTNQPNTCNPATDALRAGVLLHEYGDQSTYYFHHLHKQRSKLQSLVACSSTRTPQWQTFALWTADSKLTASLSTSFQLTAPHAQRLATVCM